MRTKIFLGLCFAAILSFLIALYNGFGPPLRNWGVSEIQRQELKVNQLKAKVNIFPGVEQYRLQLKEAEVQLKLLRKNPEPQRTWAWWLLFLMVFSSFVFYGIYLLVTIGIQAAGYSIKVLRDRKSKPSVEIVKADGTRYAGPMKKYWKILVFVLVHILVILAAGYMIKLFIQLNKMSLDLFRRLKRKEGV